MIITPMPAGPLVPGAAAATAGAAGEPSVYDVAAFRAAFHDAAAVSGPLAAAPGSIGDSGGMRAVLSTLDSLNGRAEKIEANAAIFTRGERDMTPGEMLMLTVQAHEFLFHAQLTANIANRTSDGIQQLFRQQA